MSLSAWLIVIGVIVFVVAGLRARVALRRSRETLVAGSYGSLDFGAFLLRLFAAGAHLVYAAAIPVVAAIIGLALVVVGIIHCL